MEELTGRQRMTQRVEAPRASSPISEGLLNVQPAKRSASAGSQSVSKRTRAAVTKSKTRDGDMDAGIVVEDKRNSEEFPSDMRPAMYREDNILINFPSSRWPRWFGSTA